MINIENFKKEYHKTKNLEYHIKNIVTRRQELIEKISREEHNRSIYIKSNTFILDYIQAIKKKQIDSIVEIIDDIIYPEFNLKIKFELVESKNNLTVDILMSNDDGVTWLSDLYETFGYGPLDIISIIIRIIFLIKSKGQRLIILDEPFKAVDIERKEVMIKIILTIIKKFDCQFLYVTHEKEYLKIVNKVVEITSKN